MMNTEDAYIEGTRHVWRRLLQEACQHLGVDDAGAGQARWLLEREEARARLRELCAEFGDLDWDDSLHLADVIDKHLGKHLHAP